ncbi:hypothetical protein Tco_0901996 [Tanacetum coccineum]
MKSVRLLEVKTKNTPWVRDFKKFFKRREFTNYREGQKPKSHSIEALRDDSGGRKMIEKATLSNVSHNIKPQ